MGMGFTGIPWKVESSLAIVGLSRMIEIGLADMSFVLSVYMTTFWTHVFS
jgi:hypothetical protein